MKIILIACGLLCMSVMTSSREFPKNEFIMRLRNGIEMVTDTGANMFSDSLKQSDITWV